MRAIKLNSKTGERGAYFLTTAIALVAIFAVVSLGVDLALLGAAKSQQKQNADLAALAALEGYLDAETITPVPPKKFCYSAMRATDIVKPNVMASAEKANIHDINSPGVADLIPVGSQLCGLRQGNWVVSGENGTITAGTWHPTNDGNVCGEKRLTAPCFIPYVSVTNSRPTAVRVELKTSSNNPLIVLFGKIFGQASVGLRTVSTAAVVPRRTVFVLDLSPSLTDDSHPQGAPNAPKFTYFLRPGTSCAGLAGVLPANYGNGSYLANAALDLSWNSLSAARQGAYVCVDIPNTGDTGPLSSQSYLIDAQIAPQPLHSILSGIHSTLRYFESRQVAGDSVAFIGIDDAILSSRVTTLTSGPGHKNPARYYQDAGLIFPSSTTGSQFQKLLSATDIDSDGYDVVGSAIPIPIASNPSNIAARLREKFLIPRFLGSRIDAFGNRDLPYSDIPLGIRAAHEMLEAMPGVDFAENSIAIFTDGLGNCDGLSDIPNCIESGARYCDLAPGEHQRSQAEMLCLTKPLSDKNIVVHWFVSGANAGPQTTLLVKRGDPANGSYTHLPNCADDRYYREHRNLYPSINPYRGEDGTQDQHFDYGDCYYESGGACIGSNYTLQRSPYTASDPAFDTGKLFDISYATGGLWAPMRPPCVPNDGSTVSGFNYSDCRSGQVSDYINQACTNAAVDPPQVTGTGFTTECEDHSRPGSRGYGDCRDSGENPDYGRLLCDPLCRTKAEQVRDYLGELQKYTPYVLVE